MCVKHVNINIRLTKHMVRNMNLNVPFTVEDHLALNALVCLLLKKNGNKRKPNNQWRVENRE